MIQNLRENKSDITLRNVLSFLLRSAVLDMILRSDYFHDRVDFVFDLILCLM